MEMPRRVSNAIDAAAGRRSRRATLSVGRRELCDYVANISSEFRDLARSHDLRFLAYLLAMVFEEAANQARVSSYSEPSLPASTEE
jgi:hypothetical protein